MRGRREERLRIEPTRPSVYREGTGSGAEFRQVHNGTLDVSISKII